MLSLTRVRAVDELPHITRVNYVLEVRPLRETDLRDDSHAFNRCKRHRAVTQK